MDKSQNPYASPRSHGVVANDSPDDPKLRHHPLLSRALSGLLAVNVIAFITILGIIVFSEGELDGLGIVGGGLIISAIWIVFAWPVVSLVALVYSVTIDRGTERSELKAFVALLMLFAWAAVFLWIVAQ